jgi:hypothetical protein
MRTFPVYALISVAEMRRRLNYIQFAANDGKTDWESAFGDNVPENDMHDPATGRYVDQVVGQFRDGQVETRGVPAEMSFTDKFPYKELTLQWPGGRIEQVGEPVRVVIDGVVDDNYTIFGNAVLTD